jgi:hypothetical protein
VTDEGIGDDETDEDDEFAVMGIARVEGERREPQAKRVRKAQ